MKDQIVACIGSNLRPRCSETAPRNAVMVRRDRVAEALKKAHQPKKKAKLEETATRAAKSQAEAFLEFLAPAADPKAASEEAHEGETAAMAELRDCLSAYGGGAPAPYAWV